MCRCFDWDAWYDRMPGADEGILRVAGSCEVSSSSIQLALEPDNEGVVDDPELFVLRLAVDKPDIGDTMVATKPISGEWDAPGIKRVSIRVPNSEPVTVSVRDAS